MRTAKNIIVLSLGVLAGLFVGEMVLRVTQDWLPQASDWPTVETELKHQQLANHRMYEVIFLGSSVTEAAVDPDLLGYDAYNAALPFSSPISLDVWFDGEFGGPNTPDVVVLGLPVWPSHETLETDLIAGALSVAFDSPSEDEQLHLLRDRGVLADWFDLHTRRRTLKSELWTSRGHQTIYSFRTGGTLVGRFPPYGVPAMSAESERAIRDLAGQVESSGSRLVMMIEPGRFPGDAGADEIHAYLRSLNDLAADLDVPIWDTYSLTWDPLWYADEAHFNLEGTVHFTEYVSQLLSSLD